MSKKKKPVLVTGNAAKLKALSKSFTLKERQIIPGEILREEYFQRLSQASRNDVQSLMGQLEQKYKPIEPSKMTPHLARPYVKRNLTGEFLCDYPVKMVAGLSLEQADQLLNVYAANKNGQTGIPFKTWNGFNLRPIILDISYPLNSTVRLGILPMRRRFLWGDDHETYQEILSPGYLMYVVAQEYQRIYQEPEKYGVWGHSLEQLHFEGFKMHRNGYVDLYIGS